LFGPAILILLFSAGSALGASGSVTYTVDADFDEGTLVNVNHDSPNNDQLQLDSVATPFEFIWIAKSGRGTVVKIDTNTGTVLGEYRTTPSSQALGNPSRTTVDSDGSVWVANRNNVYDTYGSVLHIGLLENGQCEDRNGNGAIDTSTALGDVKAWTDLTTTVDGRPVATAADECIVHYTKVNSRGTRHVSVDANNDVWVGGVSTRNFDLIKGGRYDVPASGTIIRSEPSVGYGGYGGLIDGNGVIWSARSLLRWDTLLPLTGLNGDPGGASIGPPVFDRNWAGKTYVDSYGMCIDSQGNVWNTQLSGNAIRKYAPDGTYLGSFAHGNNYAQGCVVDGNDHVWVAHSLLGPQNTVGHILNDGTYVGNVTVGHGPTGVAVDAQGKVWAANYNSHSASRIDPAAGPVGGGGFTVGAVDLTVPLGASAYPYNYSDMTGSTLIAPPNSGTWSVVYDSDQTSAPWREISWTSYEPEIGSIVVEVAGSTDGSTPGPFEAISNGGDPTFDAQYLHINVAFARGSGGDSPILYDLTALWNRDPVCDFAYPSIDTIWPPNHKFVSVDVLGVTDPDGDAFTITVHSIFQDEPVDTFGDGTFVPDGQGIGTATAEVRAERSGNPNVPGNGRVYHIGFTAEDTYGGSCSGVLNVGVPHDVKDTPIDEGPIYDSTAF
jgi:streptogramin lyase